MESNLARVIATTAIWGAFAIVMGIVAGSLTELNLVIFGAIMTAAAAGSTTAVWVSGRGGTMQPAETAMEKTKRVKSMRVSRIVDTLSDDELDQLRARLEEREQTVPLESLLSQSQRQER